jgi:transcriptional regulator with XRE-family HTH domain
MHFRGKQLKVDIGGRLKRLRGERGLTQKELASRVRGGVDYTYIGKIERGEQLPSLKILLKIGDALSVPVNYFFQDEAAAVMDEVSLELKSLAKDEEGRELLRILRLLHREDVPLVIEIIRVLSRYRMREYESSNETYLKAAEEEEGYGKG